jgi:hypothetical protein
MWVRRGCAVEIVEGCGNSRLGEEMMQDEIKNIWCMDYSEVLIGQLQERSKSKYLPGVGLLRYGRAVHDGRCDR